jgi:hypothetical protein
LSDLLAALQTYLAANLVATETNPLDNPWPITGVRIMGAYESTAGWSVGSLPIVILTPLPESERPGPFTDSRTVVYQIRIRCIFHTTVPEGYRTGADSIYNLSDRIRALLAANKRIGEADDFLNGTAVEVLASDLDGVGDGPGRYIGRDIIPTWFRYETWTGSMNNQPSLALPAQG